MSNSPMMAWRKSATWRRRASGSSTISRMPPIYGREAPGGNIQRRGAVGRVRRASRRTARNSATSHQRSGLGSAGGSGCARCRSARATRTCAAWSTVRARAAERARAAAGTVARQDPGLDAAARGEARGPRQEHGGCHEGGNPADPAPHRDPRAAERPRDGRVGRLRIEQVRERRGLGHVGLQAAVRIQPGRAQGPRPSALPPRTAHALQRHPVPGPMRLPVHQQRDQHPPPPVEPDPARRRRTRTARAAAGRPRPGPISAQ